MNDINLKIIHLTDFNDPLSKNIQDQLLLLDSKNIQIEVLPIISAKIAKGPPLIKTYRLLCKRISSTVATAVIVSNMNPQLFFVLQILLGLHRTPLIHIDTTKSPKILKNIRSEFFRFFCKSWIPILMYHKIPDQDLENETHQIFVKKSTFEQHLRFFKFLGCQSLTFQDIDDFKNWRKPISEFPKKPLILTFDDGYKDNLLNAAPLLKKYGFSAIIYLLADIKVKTNKWDFDEAKPSFSAPLLSAIERKELLNTKFEIGSHGFSHLKITDMTKEEAWHELLESKKTLEAEFGIHILSFAFTYGSTHSEFAKLAKDAGYHYALNTDSGGLHMEDDPHSIFRVNIFPNESYLSLWKKTSGWYRKYYFKKRKQ